MKPLISLKSRAADIVLDSARVRLKPATERDYAAWVAVRRANAELLRPLEPRWPDDALTEAFFERRISAQREDWKAGRACSFLVWHKDGALIGGFNLNNVCRGAAQYASPGYWLDAAWQGQGLMTEAAEAGLAFAFGQFGLQRLNAATLPHNARSQAMLKRLGFVEEGFARQYIQIDGVWRDHALFGLTRDDWAARKTAIQGT